MAVAREIWTYAKIGRCKNFLDMGLGFPGWVGKRLSGATEVA